LSSTSPRVDLADFWSIWVGRRTSQQAEILRELGHDVPGPNRANALGNRLYHTAIVVAALSAVTTGVLMMPRVRTPFLRGTRICSRLDLGVTYVTHGLAGVGLVGLVIAHVYFAVRPDKWWITKSMLLGWITRRQYLEHHEPERWRVVANPPTSRT
jgi:thiosulfate reductase cytochrome b subunit